MVRFQRRCATGPPHHWKMSAPPASRTCPKDGPGVHATIWGCMNASRRQKLSCARWPFQCPFCDTDERVSDRRQPATGLPPCKGRPPLVAAWGTHAGRRVFLIVGAGGGTDCSVFEDGGAWRIRLPHGGPCPSAVHGAPTAPMRFSSTFAILLPRVGNTMRIRSGLRTARPVRLSGRERGKRAWSNFAALPGAREGCSPFVRPDEVTLFSGPKPTRRPHEKVLQASCQCHVGVCLAKKAVPSGILLTILNSKHEIDICQEGRDPQTLTAEQQREDRDVLPGFSDTLAACFPDLDRMAGVDARAHREGRHPPGERGETLSSPGVFDEGNPPRRGPPFELGSAIAASSQRVALRIWQGTPWYVAWVKLPIQDQPTPRYRVARLTPHGFEGWQVRNIAQVEVLLAHFWGIDPTNGREVWADWTPIEQPLERIVGEIPYSPY